MVQLTIEQKIEAYKIALDQAENSTDPEYGPFVCVSLTGWLRDHKYKFGRVFEYFPEFTKYKPSDRFFTMIWWSDNELRIKAINQVIEELQQQLTPNI